MQLWTAEIFRRVWPVPEQVGQSFFPGISKKNFSQEGGDVHVIIGTDNVRFWPKEMARCRDFRLWRSSLETPAGGRFFISGTGSPEDGEDMKSRLEHDRRKCLKGELTREEAAVPNGWIGFFRKVVFMAAVKESA